LSSLIERQRFDTGNESSLPIPRHRTLKQKGLPAAQQFSAAMLQLRKSRSKNPFTSALPPKPNKRRNKTALLR
jgi:hypothetical protein